MAAQSIEYLFPTNRAFGGMKRILFAPFNLGKWFVLGFTVWLAGLLDGGSSSGGSVESSGDGTTTGDAIFQEVSKWVQENLELAIGIGVTLLALGLALFIVLLWISSRGKFMFLDNVIYNRARVKAPWREFRTQGDSLFWWRLVFTMVALIVFFTLAGGGAAFIYMQVQAEAWNTSATVIAIALGLALFLGILLLGYIALLLEDFVIPLMYRDHLTANEAWRRFLALHRSTAGYFVLYALWKALWGLIFLVGILAVGFATCCIGFIIMAIPYLGSVLLLPVSVFFRLLGPEFLKQFGSEYDILIPPEGADPARTR